MNVQKISFGIILFLIIGLLVSAPFAAHADDSAPPLIDVSFPCPDTQALGLGEGCGDATGADIAGYLIRFYQFAIAASGILAVGLIAVGSIYISTAGGSADRQSEGREMITSALWGIVLLFGSYLILRTVNPRLVSLANPTIEKVDLPVCEYDEANDPEHRQPKNSPCRPPVLEITLKNQCAAFKDIPVYSGEVPKGSCAYRRSIAPEEFSVGSGDYYDESEEVPKNSTIWLYPYFKSDQETSTAKCLVYAYQDVEGEKNGGEVKLIDINPNLELCASQKQESSSKTLEDANRSQTCSSNETIPNGFYQTDEEPRDKLEAAGIDVRSSGNCNNRCNKNCTSLKGIPKNTVDKLVLIQKDCQAKWPTCDLTVTGGTEVGHKTHGIGQPAVDISYDPLVGAFLRASSNIQKYGVLNICTTIQDRQFRYNCDFNENERHLHVRFN
ncbi:MAG: hypothetical protein HYU81_01755 [Candidatus Brennerbacteria bacterium]|nr:hypothetical protein [Candidatus Brennerbacteria bacterium]